MKCVLVVYEGAADVPLDDLNRRTPLEVARCPAADGLAARGRNGLIRAPREGMEGSNEIFLGALMGIPLENALALRRGPIEAIGKEANVAGYKFAYAASFVTVDDDSLRDCTVSGLSFEETQSLASALTERWQNRDICLQVLEAGRVLVLSGDERASSGYPPCLMEGERVTEFFPGGKSAGLPGELLRDSMDVLSSHPVNDVRLDLGENPANALWVWGGGPLDLTVNNWTFSGHEHESFMMTQCAMARGLGLICGMSVEDLLEPWDMKPGEPAFKLARVTDSLRDSELIIVYVKTPRAQGRYGAAVEKVRALEMLDQHVLAPLLSLLDSNGAYRVALVSDGVVSTKDKHPVSGNVPIVIAGADVEPDTVVAWDEQVAAAGALGIMKPGDVLPAMQEEL